MSYVFDFHQLTLVDHMFHKAMTQDLAGLEGLRLAGCDINYTDRMWNLVTFAAIYDKNDSVKYLVDNGADLDFPDRMGSTPLMYAIVNDNMDVFRMVVEKSDLHAVDLKGMSVLDHACRAANTTYVIELLKNNFPVSRYTVEATTAKVQRPWQKNAIRKILTAAGMPCKEEETGVRSLKEQAMKFTKETLMTKFGGNLFVTVPKLQGHIPAALQRDMLNGIDIGV